jgi:acetyl-CoA carboxylase carboxyl transferase subunit beta
MNWISNVVRPKIRGMLRREVPENLWIKCPETGQLVFYKDVEANQFVIPGSNYHMRMSAGARLKSMFDNETWFDIAVPEVPLDPLKFRDERRYADRLKDARSKTGLNDAIKLGYGKLDGLATVIAAQDFDFMGGPRHGGGEAAQASTPRGGLSVRPVRRPAAPGAEGILSLMQMPRTTIAVSACTRRAGPISSSSPIRRPAASPPLRDARRRTLPSRALIGFAGPRVIEQTIREKLPRAFKEPSTCATTAWSTWSCIADLRRPSRGSASC